jgi:hypothetical protein
MSHCRLLSWSSARDWVGSGNGLPGLSIWQAGKMPLRSMAGTALKKENPAQPAPNRIQPEHDPEMWKPVFRKDHAQSKR